jgi:hypothetical protein
VGACVFVLQGSAHTAKEAQAERCECAARRCLVLLLGLLRLFSLAHCILPPNARRLALLLLSRTHNTVLLQASEARSGCF